LDELLKKSAGKVIWIVCQELAFNGGKK
jgi:hypothetical protein